MNKAEEPENFSNIVQNSDRPNKCVSGNVDLKRKCFRNRIIGTRIVKESQKLDDNELKLYSYYKCRLSSICRIRKGQPFLLH